MVLTDVRFSASARRNLISLGQLESHGCWFQSKNYRLNIFKEDKEVLAANYIDTLYFLDGTPVKEEMNSAEDVLDMTTLWHSRLGHRSVKGMQCLVKVGFLKNFEVADKQECEHYVLGKLISQDIFQERKTQFRGTISLRAF